MVEGSKAAIVGILPQPMSAEQLVQAGKITLKGDGTVFEAFARVMDEFDANFNMVTP